MLLACVYFFCKFFFVYFALIISYELREVIAYAKERDIIMRKNLLIMEVQAFLHFLALPGKNRGTLLQYFSYSGYFPPLISSANDELP